MKSKVPSVLKYFKPTATQTLPATPPHQDNLDLLSSISIRKETQTSKDKKKQSQLSNQQITQFFHVITPQHSSSSTEIPTVNTPPVSPQMPRTQSQNTHSSRSRRRIQEDDTTSDSGNSQNSDNTSPHPNAVHNTEHVTRSRFVSQRRASRRNHVRLGIGPVGLRIRLRRRARARRLRR